MASAGLSWPVVACCGLLWPRARLGSRGVRVGASDAWNWNQDSALLADCNDIDRLHSTLHLPSPPEQPLSPNRAASPSAPGASSTRAHPKTVPPPPPATFGCGPSIPSQWARGSIMQPHPPCDKDMQPYPPCDKENRPDDNLQPSRCAQVSPAPVTHSCVRGYMRACMCVHASVRACAYACAYVCMYAN